MQAIYPHFLLFSEGGTVHCPFGWRFVLESVASGRRFAAGDIEPISSSNRLELLAVVRGLESLDGPARVTLITSSRYVSRGLKGGLSQWRAKGWNWERFGRIVPIRDHDLWQRIDRALQFHAVECRLWALHGNEAVAAAHRPEWSEAGLPVRHRNGSPAAALRSDRGDRPAKSPFCRESTEPALAGA